MKFNSKHPPMSKDFMDPFKEESFYNDRQRKKRLSDQIWGLPEFNDDDSIDSINEHTRKYRSVPVKEHRLKKPSN